MTMKKSIIFCVLASVFILSNCTTAFIDEGETTTPVGEVTYTNDVSAIMFNYCLTCHGTTTPSAGLSLTTYDQVRNAAENGRLLTYIEDSANPMPPSGLMPAAERAKIAKWVADGYKN